MLFGIVEFLQCSKKRNSHSAAGLPPNTFQNIGVDSVLEPTSFRNVEVRELHEEYFLSDQEIKEEGDEEYDFESDGEKESWRDMEKKNQRPNF